MDNKNIVRIDAGGLIGTIPCHRIHIEIPLWSCFYDKDFMNVEEARMIAADIAKELGRNVILVFEGDPGYKSSEIFLG